MGGGVVAAWGIVLARDRRVVLGAPAPTPGFRLFYALAVNDPMSGPDAATYGPAADAFAHHGPLAEATGIPRWPAGYPLLLAPFYVLDGARLAMAVQVVVVSVATYFAWTLVRREL